MKLWERKLIKYSEVILYYLLLIISNGPDVSGISRSNGTVDILSKSANKVTNTISDTNHPIANMFKLFSTNVITIVTLYIIICLSTVFIIIVSYDTIHLKISFAFQNASSNKNASKSTEDYPLLSKSIVKLCCVIDVTIDFTAKKLFGDRLYSSIRILCLVLSRPDDIRRHAAIASTWGKRCNRVLIVIGNAQNTHIVYDNENNRKIGKLMLNIVDNYSMTWHKVRAALVYVHENIDIK